MKEWQNYWYNFKFHETVNDTVSSSLELYKLQYGGFINSIQYMDHAVACLC